MLLGRAGNCTCREAQLKGPKFLVCLAELLVCLLIRIVLKSTLTFLFSQFLQSIITVQLLRPVLSHIKQIQCLECGIRSWVSVCFIPISVGNSVCEH